MAFYKDADFQQWLVDNGDKQASQTKGYIDSIIINVLEPYKMEGIITSLSKAILDTYATLAKLEELEVVLRKAAALKMSNPNAQFLVDFKGKATSLNAWCTGLNKYIQFLRETTTHSKKYVNWGAQAWNKAFNSFWTMTVKSLSIDGYSFLLNAPAMNGNEDAFVKYAIESSFFLNATAVKSQHSKLQSDIDNGVSVYARKSTDTKVQNTVNGQLVFLDKGNAIPIIKDPDGNKAVRVLIEEFTGYTVSSGYADIFTNYKISHVWGNAFDPRFFTGLWNVVIIPAWANDLMDKTNSKNSLSLKMINTVKAICEKLYSCNNYWNAMSINASASNTGFVVHGTYNLKVLRNKTGNSLIGTIVEQSVVI